MIPHPTLVPVTGVIKGVGTGADEELGPTGDDVVGAGVGTVVVVDTDEGAGMDDGAGTDAGASTGAVGTAAVGTGVDADAGYEEGTVAEFAEPEGMSVWMLKEELIDWHFQLVVLFEGFGCLQPYSPFRVSSFGGMCSTSS